MKNNDNAETLKTRETVVLGGWNKPIKAFPTVEIPLDEYKAFIEFKVKGNRQEYRHCYKKGSGRNHRKDNERFTAVIRRAEKRT